MFKEDSYLDRNFPLSVLVESSGDDYTKLTLVGEVDIYTLPHLEQHFEVIDNSCRGVVIDLQKITYFGADGLRFILRMLQRAREIRKDLRIKVDKKTHVHRILKIVDRNDLLPIE